MAEKNFNILSQARSVADPVHATLRLWDLKRQRQAAAQVREVAAVDLRGGEL
jgi:hypothetical protein